MYVTPSRSIGSTFVVDVGLRERGSPPLPRRHLTPLFVQTGTVDDCETCDTAGVPGTGVIPWDIDATTEALIHRVSAGRMRELRGDVLLEDMVALLVSETKYTIASFVECLDCGRVLFWGLCIRGNPILRHAERTEIDRWPWDAVPPRERWART